MPAQRQARHRPLRQASTPMTPQIPTTVTCPLLFLGDCIEHLRTLPDHSMDSGVLDPPAGIGFMHSAAAGRTWDKKAGYQPVTDRGREVLASLGSSSIPKRFRDDMRARITKAILDCCECAVNYGDDLYGPVGGVAGAQAMALGAVADQGLLEAWEVGFLAFMTDVFVELLRVMKPGAHALSWALPRTQDLTMMALRFAGWDVREVCAHLFSSGFPKSLRVGPALDKAAGVTREVVGVRTRQGFTPTKDEITNYGIGEIGAPKTDVDITAPATDLGKKHDGDGTALSPGHESWILARAPLAAVPPEELHTASGQDYWWSPSTLHIGTDKQRETSAKHWPDQRAQMDADVESHAVAMLDWGVEFDNARTRAGVTMAKAELAWAERPPGEDFAWGMGDDAPEPEPIDLDQLGDLGAEAKRAQSILESLESSKPKLPAWVAWSGRSLRPSVPSRVDLRRDGEVVASVERPYTDAGIKTVAANVMRWGTGGIRIDDTRTPTSDDCARKRSMVNGPAGFGQGFEMGGNGHTSGRWPKSVLLTCALACDGDDHTPWCPSEEVGRQSGERPSVGARVGGGDGLFGMTGNGEATGRGDAGTAARFFPRFKPHDPGCPVGELDRQSGVLTSGSILPHHVSKGGDNLAMSGPNTPRTGGTSIGDSGGASRFFPRFHYFPKASDRTVTGRDDLTNKHPTLKNPDLMRWLIRLITPRGGVVIDPFMGSGTTGWACIAEGVRFVGIEQSVEHYTIARARVDGAVGSPESADAGNAAVEVGGQLGLL